MSGLEREQKYKVRVSSSGIREITPMTEHEPKVKLAVFIDSANIYKSVDPLLKEGEGFSLEKLFALISNNNVDSMRVNYYCTNPPTDVFDFLIKHGVRIVDIPGKEIRPDERKAGPVDTVIATELINQADSFEQAVLVSGDGDFGYTLEQLILKGKKVKVISTLKTLGRELSASGAEIVFLDPILSQLTYRRNGKNARPQLRAV